MIGDDWAAIAAVFGVLFGLGYVYNLAVGWLERRGYAEGYEWALVVTGTLLTLGGIAVLDWRAAVLALGAFACTGFWMAVGAWWRYVQRRARGQAAQRREIMYPGVADDDEGA